MLVVHVASEYGRPTLCHAFFTGVPAFFQLSAFLLTYRLLVQYEQIGARVPLITFKYFVTRFFRIYVTFVAYCAIAYIYESCVFPEDTALGQRLISVALMSTELLKQNGTKQFHLWTIPNEVTNIPI